MSRSRLDDCVCDKAKHVRYIITYFISLCNHQSQEFSAFDYPHVNITATLFIADNLSVKPTAILSMH